MKRISTLVGDNPVQVKLYRFPVSQSTTYVWNGLFQVAVKDDVEYFMVGYAHVHEHISFAFFNPKA